MEKRVVKKSELEIESVVVEAFESCVPNYQRDVNWPKVMEAIEKLKTIFRRGVGDE